jgi:hypothetical protein
VAFGPILIFDKSALESLSVDEGVWLDNFYRTTLTPLFFVETLADLEKAVADGRTPEAVVGNLALKTPMKNSLPNVHHRTLALGELLGHAVEMRHFPIVAGGRPVRTSTQRGIVFDVMPEYEAFQRWQDGAFLALERGTARLWRQALSNIDLEAIYQHFRPGPGTRLPDLAAVKAAADAIVRRDRARYELLKIALAAIRVPPAARAEVLKRWKGLGGPPLWEFAPYTAHVLTVDIFFNLAIGSGLIGRERASNKIDIAYLYYLPFCMVFASGDRLHKRAVPCFLGPDQEFLDSATLKADLARLDAHFSALPAEVRARGLTEFATYPPNGDFLATRLWDRFLPAWRRNQQRRAARSPEADESVLEHFKRVTATATPDLDTAQVEVHDADFIHFSRRVPLRLGKWQLLPPEVAGR